MEVIAKKYIKQADRQIYHVRIKKSFRTKPIMKLRSFQQKKNIKIGALFEKNIGERILKNIYTDELCNLLLWKVGQ